MSINFDFFQMNRKFISFFFNIVLILKLKTQRTRVQIFYLNLHLTPDSENRRERWYCYENILINFEMEGYFEHPPLDFKVR